MNFTDFNVEEFFGLNDDTSVFMMLIWILPVIIFVFYGQRIQLQITSGEIKKSIKKLEMFKNTGRAELVHYIQNNCDGVSTIPSTPQLENRIDQFLDYFTIPPVDLDPNGIIPKIKHSIRSREDYTRHNIKSMVPNASEEEINQIQTLLEIATSLQMLYKIVNHLFLTAKKQNNYPLILPLQMMLPFIMDEANALKEAIPAFKERQPIGDGIGPLVVGQIMLNTIKEDIAFQTVMSKKDFDDGDCDGDDGSGNRKLILVKAKGPSSTVGRPADALEKIVSNTKLDAIIMVDAALKFEGEDSASVAQGFGAAIGGIGTERFQIEQIATQKNIPVFAVIVKQSVKEAITLMTKDIAQKADETRNRVYDLIKSNTAPGSTVLVIGVGNTMGVPQ